MAKKAAKKTDDTPSSGGRGKLIIILVAVLVLLGAGGAAAWFFLMGQEPQVEQDLGPKPLIYFRFAKPVTATMPPDEPVTHLRLNVVLATRDPTVVRALELHTPMLRNDLLALLSEQTYDTLNTPEGKELLREQVHEVTTAVLVRTGSPAGIENVFFDEIVMQ